MATPTPTPPSPRRNAVPISASDARIARSQPSAPFASGRNAQASPAQPRVFVGSLIVGSEPVATSVFIDRQYVGETPLEVSNLRAGSHVVWIERESYVRWTGS